MLVLPRSRGGILTRATTLRISPRIPQPTYCIVMRGGMLFDLVSKSLIPVNAMTKGQNLWGDCFNQDITSSGSNTLATYPSHDLDTSPMSGLVVGVRARGPSSESNAIRWASATYSPAALNVSPTNFELRFKANSSSATAADIPVAIGEKFSVAFRAYDGLQRGYSSGKLFLSDTLNSFWSASTTAVSSATIAQPPISCNLFVGWMGVDIGERLVSELSENPARLFEDWRVFIPTPAASGATYTLSSATYAPGSITAAGVTPRVSVAVA